MDNIVIQDSVSGKKRQISRSAYSILLATGNTRWTEVAEPVTPEHPKMAEGLEDAPTVITKTGGRRKKVENS